MGVEWDRCESGPADADRCVLLLPGGLISARSYAELMAQPALGEIRLVAATLPGHSGTPSPGDYGVETCARATTELVAELDCDVIVGFSMGATVALEMVASGAFTGPVVLMGISMSREDEAVFLRVLDKLTAVSGAVPFAAMRRMMGSFTKSARVPEARQRELLADLRNNDPTMMRRSFRAYLEYLDRHDAPAARLCAAGVPTWVVHAEKGDGDLTDDERRTLEACPNATVITIPGSSFFLPNEEPGRIAAIVVEALNSR